MKRIVGKHLFGTLTDCKNSILSSIDTLRDFLYNFHEKINMRRIEFDDNSNPLIKECDGGNTLNGEGISGIVLLHTSHFSIHTWPNYNEVDLDIFSCDDFNHEDVVKYLENFFQGSVLDLTVLTRGREYSIVKSGLENRT